MTTCVKRNETNLRIATGLEDNERYSLKVIAQNEMGTSTSASETFSELTIAKILNHVIGC